jgi:hypothetical protein
MMTGGGANCQLKALIEVLAPFTSPNRVAVTALAGETRPGRGR